MAIGNKLVTFVPSDALGDAIKFFPHPLRFIMAKKSKRLRRKSQMLEAYHGGVSYSSLTRHKKARTGERDALLPPNCQDENNEEVIREQEGSKCLDITSVACQGSKWDKDGDYVDKSGMKCDGDDMSDGCRNKHDPQCDSNVTSDSHGNKGDACDGDENRDRDCDGYLAQVDKIWQTPTRNFHALGTLSRQRKNDKV